MDAIKTKGILVTFYRNAIGGDYLEALNIAIEDLKKLSLKVKQVQCRNCQDIVETKNMSPKEKATELGNKFYRGDIFTHGKEAHLLELEQARKYALICVDEILNDNPNIYDSDRLNNKYWKEVKKQIELL